MPVWMQLVIGFAAFLGAFGLIWRTAIKPAAKVITQAETTLPLLAVLTKEWADAPNLPSVLREISDQFKTDGGSSLRDCVNRLEKAAADNRLAAEENSRAAVSLNLQMEVNRALSDNDRRIMDRLVAMVNVLDARVQVGVSGVADIQVDRASVAADLADAHARADSADSTHFGEAADAAARTELNQ